MAIILSGVLLLIMSFIPTAIYSKYKNRTVDAQLGLVKSTQTTDEKETSLIVTKLNGLADVLSRDSDQISSIGLVDKILSLKNSNISLVSLSILEGENGLRKITVSGISRSRDDLTRFNKNLISDGSFGNIDLPVSNLIKNSDLNFTMTMTHK
jgi:hypothetical protein